MFKSLMKSRLQMMINQMFTNIKGKKKKSPILKVGIALLFVYVIACFFFMFGAFFYELVKPFHAAGLDWFYFTFAFLMALVLMIIGSIFATQSQIYDAKDNELLLSMPIPPRAILASRMVVLYALNLAFELLVLLPVFGVYFYGTSVETGSVIAGIVVIIFLPFLGLALSCVLGWFVNFIGSRTRNKSLMTMVLSLLFLGIYIYFYSQIGTYLKKLIANGSLLAGKVKGAAAPLYWIGNAVSEGDVPYLLLSIILILVLFGVIYMVISMSFIKMITTKKGFAKKKYVEVELKVAGVDSALYRKEMKHFLASPIYMLNSALGLIFILIGLVYLIMKKDTVLSYIEMIPMIKGMFGSLLVGALCAASTVNMITAPSISLEGKNLWLMQSLPINPSQVLKSKLSLHLSLTTPVMIIAAIVGTILFDLSILEIVLLFIAPVLMNVCCALLGLIVNLHFPKFDWESEAAVVKQSAAILISLAISMGMVMVPAMLYLLVLEDMLALDIYLLIITIVLAIASVTMYQYVMTKGCKIFKRL
ncbi:ABC transporter, permease protein [Lachnospiraceae bacterium KM106-2]|nr:ABC transporter, permease protein [Lachnospiraceae bacterium KM106-2]